MSTCNVVVGVVDKYTGSADCWDRAYKRHSQQEDVTRILSAHLSVMHGNDKNELLRSFYGSDNDFVALFDYDTCLKSYYEAYRFFMDVSNYAMFEQIGVVRSFVPSVAPFKKYNFDHAETVSRGWILNPSVAISPPGLVVVPNVRKRIGREVYFSESKGSLGYNQYDFVLSLVESGVPSYVCRQLVTSTPVETKHDVSTRRASHIQNVCLTYARHPSLNIRYVVDNGKVKSDVRKLNTRRTVVVPRSVVYTFDKNLLPKRTDSSEFKKVQLV